jgi:hypothetical protein
MIRLRLRTVMIGLTILAVLLGLIRSKAAPGRADQLVLTDIIIMCLVFCGAITVIGNTRSPWLALALFALLAALAVMFF